jgi:tyrosine-specific transport protein
LLSQPNHLDIRPVPLIITAFGSAIIIPTLTEYLHGKPKQLLYVVIIGSLIPLITYIIWEFAILGIIPSTGNVSLLNIQQHGHPATDVPLALKTLLHNHWITQAASCFSIFALLTSLLGVTLSLFDFLADGLHLRKNFKQKIGLALVTFIPPLCFTSFYPKGFIIALSFAGLFVAILLGILPAMMVYQARYRLNLKSPWQMVGGKILLSISIVFFLLVSFIEIYNQFEAF